MNILYIGENNLSSTSYHRYTSLERIGHIVRVENPKNACREQLNHILYGKLHFRTGYRFLQGKIEKWIIKILDNGPKPDLIWVDSGELIGKTCLQILNKINVPVILYNVDDPTGKRDGNRFKSLLKALPLYDLVVVVRKETERECIELGAKKVLLVYRSYDEEAHMPFLDSNIISENFKTDVAFIGTWMRHENRDEFLLKLIQSGISISIWGGRWSKSPLWNQLKFSYKGGALSGRDYVAAIQGAKICIGMLSKGNRDLHTQRSLEVPYAGGLLCAERTLEHQQLYNEGVEAVFWTNANECADICKKLLADNNLRESIRIAGMRKVRALGVGNEDICRKILDEITMNKQIVLENRS